MGCNTSKSLLSNDSNNSSNNSIPNDNYDYLPTNNFLSSPTNPNPSNQILPKQQPQSTSSTYPTPSQFQSSQIPLQSILTPSLPSKHQILSNLASLLNQHHPSIDPSLFNIILTKTIIFSKAKYSTSNNVYTKSIHYNIANNDITLNWKRNPFTLIKQSFNDYFNTNKQLSQLNHFEWNNPFLKPYEPFPDEDILFTKLNTNNNKITKTKFNIANISNKAILFMIYDITNINSISLLRKVTMNRTPQCIVIPVYGKEIISKKETLYILEQLHSIIGDDMYGQSLYFMNENEEHSLNKYVKVLCDDKDKKIMDGVVLVDKEGIVRLICKSEEFNVDLMKKVDDNVGKEEFNAIMNGVKEVVEEIKGECELKGRIVTVYTFNKERVMFEKEEKYYEGLYGVVGDKRMRDGIRKVVDGFDVVLPGELEEDDSEDESDNDDNSESSEHSIKVKTFNKQNAVIKKEMTNISNTIGIQFNDYEAIYTITHNIYSIHPNKSYQLDNTITTSMSLNIFLDPLHFQQQFQTSLTSAMCILHSNPTFPPITHISCLPKSFSLFPESILLFNISTSSETLLSFSSSLPSLLIIFTSSPNYFIREQTLFSLKKLLPFFTNPSIQTFIIFRGEQHEYLNFMDNLESDNNIFDKNNLPIYICNSNYISTFPFYYQNNGIESAESSFNIALLSSDRKVLYKGNGGDVYITKLINAVIEGDVECEDDVDEYKVNVNEKEMIEMINEMEVILNKGLNRIKMNYRPYVHFSYGKRYMFGTGKESVINVKVEILIKENHVDVFKENVQVKGMLKKMIRKYNAVVLVIPLECCDMEMEMMCKKCGENIEGSGFYYEQEEGVYCEKCESDIKKGKTFRIYVKTKNLDNEIIEEFYNKNVYMNEPIDKSVDDICDLCEEEMKGAFYLSMTQVNTKVGFIPFCICGECFGNLCKGKTIKKGKIEENMKRFCVNTNNLIFRKISYD